MLALDQIWLCVWLDCRRTVAMSCRSIALISLEIHFQSQLYET